MDILAANPLARALYSPVFDDPRRPPNIARFQFEDALKLLASWGATSGQHQPGSTADRV